jgi:hypothetical protein
MADLLMSYAIVIGIGVFLAAVLFTTRFQRIRHTHEVRGGSVSHAEAA